MVYKVIDDCNKKAIEMKSRFEKLESEIEKAEEVIRKAREEKKELRIKEVDNVIQYIRSYKKILTDSEIDAYLCHCQNTLNGNLDGVYLTFDKGE